MMIFSLIFVSLLFYARDSLAAAKPAKVGTQKGSRADVPKGSYAALFLIIGTVVMRSWAQMGLMAYIPFYYIDHLKGEPIYAGQLMSVFLLGGVVGTLVGSYLADRWGHKFFLILSMTMASLLFPLIFVFDGFALLVALALVGMALISSFTVTIVMAQQLLPNNLGIASGLMDGFAIGTGGVGVTMLGVIADYFGVPNGLKSIILLPITGVLLCIFIRYPAVVRKRS
jgi:FSR family fosmidomycin resistance protein-like MFS transporter